jgi:hypothetical protein
MASKRIPVGTLVTVNGTRQRVLGYGSSKFGTMVWLSRGGETVWMYERELLGVKRGR